MVRLRPVWQHAIDYTPSAFWSNGPHQIVKGGKAIAMRYAARLVFFEVLCSFILCQTKLRENRFLSTRQLPGYYITLIIFNLSTCSSSTTGQTAMDTVLFPHFKSIKTNICSTSVSITALFSTYTTPLVCLTIRAKIDLNGCLDCEKINLSTCSSSISYFKVDLYGIRAIEKKLYFLYAPLITLYYYFK